MFWHVKFQTFTYEDAICFEGGFTVLIHYQLSQQVETFRKTSGHIFKHNGG